MKKAVILGMRNSGNYNIIKIKKHKKLVDWLSKFFSEGFNKHYDMVDRDSGKYRYVEKYIDWYEDIIGIPKIHGRKFHVGVIYGKKIIFIVIICSKKQREKFIKILEKISKFYKPKTSKGKLILK